MRREMMLVLVDLKIKFWVLGLEKKGVWKGEVN